MVWRCIERQSQLSAPGEVDALLKASKEIIKALLEENDMLMKEVRELRAEVSRLNGLAQY